MLIRPNSGVVGGTILTADGEVASKPTVILSSEEASLLRQYKKFLMKHGLREAVYCNTCFDGDLDDGMRAFVRDDQILFECRHRMLFYQGQSF